MLLYYLGVDRSVSILTVASGVRACVPRNVHVLPLKLWDLIPLWYYRPHFVITGENSIIPFAQMHVTSRKFVETSIVSLNSLFWGNLSLSCLHRCRWIATVFVFMPGQCSKPCYY